MKFQGLLLLAFWCSWSAAAAEKQVLTIQKAWEFKRIGIPTLSPDGRFAVVPVASADMKESKLETDLWLFATDGSRAQQLTSNVSDELSPVFSPDGRWLAFTTKRDKDKSPQIYVLPVAGGEARRVSEIPTGVSDVKWFADSASLSFVTRVWPELNSWEEQAKRLKEREESKMSAMVWTSGPVTNFDTFVDERQAHIYRIKLEGGQVEPITLKAKIELLRRSSDSGHYDVSPDGRTIALVSDSSRIASESNSDIYLLKIGDSKAINISANNPAADTSPRWSPDGKKLAWAQGSVPGFYGDSKHLVVASSDGSQSKVYFKDWDRSVDNFVWAGDSQRLFGSIDDAATTRIYELPLNGAPRAVTRETSFNGLAVSRSKETVLVATRQSFVEAPTLVKVDPRSGQATVLSHLNDALQNSIAWGSYESVTYKGADGHDIQMWVNYPAGFDRNRKYPVFMMLHGGPYNAITDAMQWRWNAQIFAGMGYVTAWHNFHGSSGFGQAFADSISSDWMTRPYEDTMKAADWFQQQPWVDKDRMVAGGGSYGGYLASILLGKPHPFQSLIVHAGVFNHYTQYGSDWGSTKRREGDYWENPELYQNTSPHLQAKNFKTPTLVLHGQLDQRVPVNHGLELFHVLQRLGVPSKFVYFPNENHWILKPQNSVFWYSEVEKWIKQYAPVESRKVAGKGINE